MSSQSYPWIIAVVAVLVAVVAGFTALNQPIVLPASGTNEDARELLVRLQSDIAVALEAVDGRLSHAASDLRGTGLNDTAARGILLNLSDVDPAIVDCTVTDAGGTLLAAEPAAYHGVEGADLRDQPNVRHVLASKRPIMSEVITVAEGIPAAVMSTPIFTGEDRFAGFVSVVFRPEVLIGNAVGPAANGTPFQVMVVQTDGRVLYDTDTTQVGRMTFDDPHYADYPDLLDVARRTAAERYGTATYGFEIDGEAVRKEITWTTTGLHGTEWRVAVIRAVE
ncbi:MAG: cache domain-containing protein [Methanoculleus sp.]|uniref:cache domain-containing protein n=1 Tax=unclassified Methanoculleus TaxID=2619537 RepID=UPI0025D8B30B|nr:MULTISPECIES: cache domain-containing protein [unclassified Methanoculleus]MCK9318759.1 cache domain-containing protein [Methanoculleus sp.]MDD2254637.1 cache domain-containing protein [Methanoculleus sp.]MDD3216821.1 cache domain-containing protein [Methanoculleus sp.]MDD4315185.1 cache domain-containing protein [Methanoculleus sp.]MDD4471510.1 cache domain-containing protein [Methanoculleus sp.]